MKTTSNLRTLLGLALLAPLATAACSGDLAPPPEARSGLAYDTAPTVAPSDYQALVAGDNAFAADLYQQIRGDGTKNLFFSPNSISVALAMTSAGANGDTASQIADVMHYTLPPARLHPAMDRLALDLASRGADATSGKLPFEMHQMDALWGQKDYAIESPFLDTLSTSYDAGVYQLDFGTDPDGSRKTINAWVADQTDGHIKDLLGAPDVTALTRLVLTNAIYFQAAWATPFDPADTAPAAFTTATGTVTVDTMHETGMYAYAEATDVQAIELGYDGGDLALDIFLPTGTGAAALTTFEASLTGDRITSLLGSLTPNTQVQLSLPKASFTAALSLKDTLSAMGMPIAFIAGSADFSGITTVEPLHIDAVQHKGFIAIDEEGTQAAAATAVSIGAGTAAPSGLLMQVNHPYVILLRDLKSGAILFVGRVSDPSQS